MLLVTSVPHPQFLLCHLIKPASSHPLIPAMLPPLCFCLYSFPANKRFPALPAMQSTQLFLQAGGLRMPETSCPALIFTPTAEEQVICVLDFGCTLIGPTPANTFVCTDQGWSPRWIVYFLSHHEKGGARDTAQSQHLVTSFPLALLQVLCQVLPGPLCQPARRHRKPCCRAWEKELRLGWGLWLERKPSTPHSQLGPHPLPPSWGSWEPLLGA